MENSTLKVSFSRILCKKFMSLTQNGTGKVSLLVFALVSLVKKHCNSTFHVPFFGFHTLIFRFLLGGGQNFVRLREIRVEAAEAIMHLKGIYGV